MAKEEKETKEVKTRVSHECWKELKILSVRNDTTISDEAAIVLEKLKGRKGKEKVEEGSGGET